MNGDLFRKLAALGLSVEQIADVVDIMDEQAEERRSKGRERWRKWKSNQTANVSKQPQTLAPNSRGGDARGEDNLQTKKISGQEEKKDSAAKPRVDLDAFRAELSSILDHDRIEALVAVRRKKGAIMTANTGRLLVAAIRRCPVPPGDVADEMALRNWTSVKPDWLESRSSAPRQSTDPPRKQTVGQQARDELRRMGMMPDATDNQNRHRDEGDGSPGFASSGLARRFAVAASR